MGRKLPAEIYTRVEVLSLLKVTGRGLTGARNKALVALLYRTGLRISEALDLRRCDIALDTDNPFVHVRNGKGGRARRVGLDEFAAAFISKWLAIRGEALLARGADAGAAPLFCTLKGGRVDTSYVRQLLPRLGQRAGLEKRVHAHGLRHTLAVELLDEGWRLDQIRRQLGHASLRVTQVYIDHLGSDDVIALANDRRS